MGSIFGLLSSGIGLALWGAIGLVAKYALVPHKHWNKVRLVDCAIIAFIMFVPTVLASGIIMLLLAILFHELDFDIPDNVLFVTVMPVYPFLLYRVLRGTWENT